MRKHQLIICGRLTLLPAIFLGGNSYGLESEILLGGGVEYSDNIRQANVGVQDELAAHLKSGLNLKEEDTNLKLNGALLLDYIDYQDNVVDDRTLFTGNLAATWMPLPNRFHWVAEDYASQTRVVVTQSASPNNLQNTNVASTGPDLFFRLSPRDQIQVSGRYGVYTFGETDTDSNRTSMSAAVRHELSTTSEASVNFDTTDVKYDNEILNTNYRRDEVYASYENLDEHTRFLLDLGMMTLDRVKPAKDVNGFLGRLQLSRDVTSVATLGATLESQYTDYGHNIVAGNVVDVSPVQIVGDDTQVAGDVYYLKRAIVQFNVLDNPFTLNSSVLVADEDYELTTNDRSQKGLNGNAGYRLAPRWIASLDGYFLRSDYSLLDRVDDESGANLGLRYLLTQEFYGVLSVGRRQRDSTDNTQDFDENLTSLLFTYQAKLTK